MHISNDVMKDICSFIVRQEKVMLDRGNGASLSQVQEEFQNFQFMPIPDVELLSKNVRMCDRLAAFISIVDSNEGPQSFDTQMFIEKIKHKESHDEFTPINANETSRSRASGRRIGTI